MEAQQILEAIQELAHAHLEGDGSLQDRGPLTPDLRLVEDLALDSLDRMTLAMEVEDRFAIGLDEADEDAIVTLGDLVAAIRRQLAGRDAQPGA